MAQEPDPLLGVRRLQSAIHALSGLLNEHDIIQVLLREAVATVGGKGAILRLLAPDGDELRLAGSIGLSQAYLDKGAVLGSKSEVDRRALAGERVLTAAITPDSGFPYAAQAATEGLQGAVVLPLNLRNRVLGVLRVFADNLDTQPLDRLATLDALADLGALALEKVRLQDSLHRLAEALNSSLELVPMLQAVLQAIVEDMGFSAAAIRLLGQDGRTLRMAASVGLSEAYLTKGDVLVAESPVDQRALAGECVVLKDLDEESGLQYLEELREEGIQAVLVVPLSLESKPRGVLRAYSSRPRLLGPVAQSYLNAVGRLVSAGIEKAELHQALRARYEDLKLDLAEWYRFLALG